MATRTISASLYNTVTCQHEDSASFGSASFGSAISNAKCLGGEVKFSNFRGWGKSYYFIIYINGEKAFETREINDQNSNTHELTTYIDTDASFSTGAILQSSVGDIEVVVIDNTSPYTDDVCSFRSGCTITIKASYEYIFSRCTAPKTVTIEKSISALSTNKLSWSNGGAGTNNAVSGYFIQYADSSDNKSWGAWAEHPTQPTGVVNSFTVNMPADNTYRKYKVWTLGSAGSSWRSADGTESGSTYRGHAALDGFTDSPLVAGQTHVKAIHMQELQDRANSLRGFYGLSAYSFSKITAGATGLKDWTKHVNEIRAAVDEISTNHAVWIGIPVNCPRADVIEQLRAVILAM